MKEYIRHNCELRGSLGLILMPLAPPNEIAVAAGEESSRLVAAIAASRAQTAESTLACYIAADRAAHDLFSKISSKIGVRTASFDDPRNTPPQLGASESSADSGYGHPTPTIFGKAWDVGSSAGDLARGTAGDAMSRASNFTGEAGSVVERTDPVSYLVPPDLGQSPIEDLRWSAGLILGGIDWVAEQFLGFSILEDWVLKPLGGDWQAIGRSSIAWGNASTSYLHMAQNFTGLPETTLDWQGAAAEAFRVSMGLVAAGLVGLSSAYGYISSLVGTVASVAKNACALIGAILSWISVKLLRLAAEAAVPVVGWAVAAAEVVELVYKIVTGLRSIQTLFNLILAAVQGFIDGKERLVEMISLIEDLARYAARDVSRGTA